MFYGQCWKCGERWGIGAASTCVCPEESTIEWTEVKLPSPVFTLDTKPNYNMTFHRDGKQVGALDFNGPEMTFTGDANESAKLFFDFIAKSFKARLEQERADERAQRTWVGLTDEERDHIWHMVGNSDAHGDVDGWSGRDVMSAIEAKLKEKNT